MKTSLTKQNKVDSSLEQGKVVFIDRLKGRVSVFLRNGLVSAASYLYNLDELRVGMSVLVGKVSNSHVIISKVEIGAGALPGFGRSFSLSSFRLTATSSIGGISSVWSDDFSGEDGSPVNPMKWSLGIGNSATIQGGMLCLDPALGIFPDFGPAFYAILANKAPNWDYYSASVYMPYGTQAFGGCGIGWWDQWLIWGIIYGWEGEGFSFITPHGLMYVGNPPGLTIDTPFWMKVVKTPTSASGYGRADVPGGEEWTLIDTIETPPNTAVYIGGGTDGWNPPSRKLLKYFDDFQIGFSSTGAVCVDLVWKGTAANFIVTRDGVEIYSGSGNAYTDREVEPMTTYLYKVFAYDSVGLQIGYGSDKVTTGL